MLQRLEALLARKRRSREGYLSLRRTPLVCYQAPVEDR